MKKIAFILGMGVVLAAVVVGGVSFWYVNTPASSSDDEVVINIPRGSGVAVIAERLEAEEVIRDARAFRLYVQAQGKEKKVKAGEYAFKKNLTPPEVLDVLVSGRTVQYFFTVPEGHNVRQIADVIAASDLEVDIDELLALSEDAKLARKLGVPADRLEGYLFPDTYSFEKNASARQILTAMVKRWDQQMTPRMKKRAKELDMTIHEVMTLASIVEKETGKPDERAVISGVFHNRLTKGMKLETDPTVIYGIKDYDGDIRYRDLRDTTNPYNTYVIKGLPPGPIASPGTAAIEAALWPAKHDYLFFVSRNDGSHQFSETYQEHARWVRKYQKRR